MNETLWNAPGAMPSAWQPFVKENPPMGELQIVRDNLPANIEQAGELSVEQMVQQVGKIQTLMTKLMKKDEHYGVIPGTGTKPTLLKPGAEKLCLMFRLAPKYEVQMHEAGDHLTIVSTCSLIHINTGAMWGTGMGSCSTKESKYAYRKGVRTCPDCGKEAIIKGKTEYGGGWLCFQKKGGCGHKWPDGAQEIEGQSTDRTDNPDKADQYNTVLKMANKRSLVAAVLNATAASDIFTQDIEDLGGGDDGGVGRGDTGPKPTDLAAPEKRRQVWEAAVKRLAGEKVAEQWLTAEYQARGITRDKLRVPLSITFGQCSEILKKLIEMGASEHDSQDAPATPTETPDPADSFPSDDV